MNLDEAELHSPLAERTLLGAVGHHPDPLADILAAVPGNDFYDPHRAAVWDACRALSADRKPVSPVTVSRLLANSGGATAAQRRIITTEMADAHTVTAAQKQAGVVTDLARRRELARAIKAAGQVVATHDGDVSEVLAAVRAKFDRLDWETERAGGTLTWAQLLDEFETAHAPGAAPEGIPSPWPELDEFTGGLFGGRMYTVGGSAGHGKSTVALNMAHYAATTGSSVLVFSKEMPTLDVTGRLVARGAEIELRAINSRSLDDGDRARFREFRSRTKGLKLRVNADPVSMTGIKHISRAVAHRSGLDVLVVDYLQLMTGDERCRSAEEEIAKISTDLKQLAMELDVAVVVPAQLNRSPSARADQRPTMADLRGSGRIEQDSDVVILLWRAPVDGRPDMHHLTLIVDKNRHGPRGEVRLRWNGGFGTVG